MREYLLTHNDKHSAEKSIIKSDGSNLNMILRGIDLKPFDNAE